MEDGTDERCDETTIGQDQEFGEETGDVRDAGATAGQRKDTDPAKSTLIIQACPQ